MTKNEALRLALEALQLVSIEFVCNGAHHAKKDRHDWLESCPIVERYQAAITAIKEALAQPAWVSLTEEDKDSLLLPFGSYWVIDAIEAKLKEKNGV